MQSCVAILGFGSCDGFCYAFAKIFKKMLAASFEREVDRMYSALSAKKHFTTFLFMMCVMSFADHAQAQTIDYSALEELFGKAVTTSATGAPQQAPNTPGTLQIITADDIRRSGARDVPDALRHVSGLSVWRGTQGQAEVSVRGYNQAYSSRLLVLVNGRQVYLDLQGYMAWSTLPIQMSEIRQIEIVRGPNSALFGFNAVSGVINIITYNPLYDDVSNATLRAGTQNYRSGSLTQTMRLSDKVAMRVSGGAEAMKEFSADAASQPFVDPNRGAMSVDALVQVSDHSQMRMEMSQARSQLTEFNPGHVADAVDYIVSSAKATYAASTPAGLLQATVYRNVLSQDARAYPGDPVPGFLIKSGLTVAQVEDIFQLGADHRFRLQGEYRSVSMGGNSLIDAGSHTGYDVYAASGMWNWSLRNNLSWVNAVRADYLDLWRKGPITPNAFFSSNKDFNDQDMFEISYNSGLVWNVTDKDTLRLTTARGVHAPSLIEFGQYFPVGPGTAIGNPRIRAAVVTHYELGYTRDIAALNGSFQANLFTEKTRDVKAFTAVFSGLAAQSGNVGTSASTGLELELGGHMLENWTWDMNYIIQNIEDDFTFVTGGVPTIPQNFQETTPLHTLNLHLGYARGPWEVDGYVHAVSDYQTRTANPVPPLFGLQPVSGYGSLSGRVGYDIRENITVALSGQQLNRADLKETFAPRVERAGFLSLSAQF